MRYTHLFFDLDNTLWDFQRNSYDALQHALSHMGLMGEIGDYDAFYAVYHQVNEHLWDLYREGKITKPRLSSQRFEESLEKFGKPMPGRGAEINETYLAEMPNRTRLMEGAPELLEYLYPRYQMAIITNGFREVQYAKLESSGLAGYFTKIFVSEEVGAQKPNKLIFTHALKSMNAPKKSTLMIGDSWEADIVGAMNSGIDHIYYNPELDSQYASPRFFVTPRERDLATVLAASGSSADQSRFSGRTRPMRTALTSDLLALKTVL